ncbi:YjjG family noncanonical pyrimidine nucleotidase [Cyclobacterium qasimii]|nr:YjjG family noncanonical pyrimidine nucleotidase [Cyclobacterium qasimii]EPR65783.1 2-haloalkanoic acid dehalogenase [Cyclobacterium qasimii M12-11B]GEO23923.1 noncanonical pyrimidine nucleotidase, YjjG family protein [Cyclobacterium qasimii]
MKKYTHLLFDLDHTLWDYDSNVRDSLTELFTDYNLGSLGNPDFELFFEAFQATNHLLWEQFNKGLIDKDELRAMRFKEVFNRAQLPLSEIPKDLEEQFILRTSSKAKVMDHAFETLDFLKTKYQLHIITNGFNLSQYNKLKSSKLDTYFDLIVTSENSGFRKPDKRIFEHALLHLKAEASHCLMIGDNPLSDIQGAQNAEIDQVYYNPLNTESEVNPTYRIRHLSELIKIL